MQALGARLFDLVKTFVAPSHENALGIKTIYMNRQRAHVVRFYTLSLMSSHQWRQ